MSEHKCEEPCPPNEPCEECEMYWHEMRQKGLWSDRKGWSDKAWKSITQKV